MPKNNNPRIQSTFETLGVRVEKEDDDGDAFLGDGVYDATGLDHLFVSGVDMSSQPNDEEHRLITEFIQKHGGKNITIGCAYETYDMVLLSGTPFLLWKSNGRTPSECVRTGGFNYGTTALLDFTKLERAPQKIVILAQND